MATIVILGVAEPGEHAVLALPVERVEEDLVERVPEPDPGQHPSDDVDDRPQRVVDVADPRGAGGDRETDERDRQPDPERAHAAAYGRCARERVLCGCAPRRTVGVTRRSARPGRP